MAKEKQPPKKRKVGRPPKNDPEDVKAIQAKIDAYFDGLKVGDEPKPPTFNGLALALGYCTRKTLWENTNSDKPISTPIKTAMTRIEEAYEERLHGNSPTGAIFALKNRGWTDKTDDKEKDETINRLLEIVTKITGQA